MRPVLWGSLVAVFAAFYVWMNGLNRSPMSAGEIVELEKKLDEFNMIERQLDGEQADPALEVRRANMKRRLLELAKQDTGRAFIAVNLLRHFAKAQYPDSYKGERMATGRDADNFYVRHIAWALFTHASYPLYVGKVTQNLLPQDEQHPEDSFYHVAALMRYRSLRDFFSIFLNEAGHAGLPHKWAALEQTGNWVTESVLDTSTPSALVGLMLLCIGLARELALAPRARL